MDTRQHRVFEDHEARREAVPLLVGLVGPSDSGKTYSACRLATGIQRVTGGEVHVIDTEAKRALHYADRFKFRHVPFGAPFGPLDYLDAFEHCVKRGARVIVTDSFSHEHEGPGGVLEMHEAETDRLAALWKTTRDKVKMSAWQKPKADRRRMINTLLQLGVTLICCFRAKEKLKIIPGREPEHLGYMAIGGEEFIYEMTVNCLLMPRAKGVPCWESKLPGERETMKLPLQFEGLFAAPGPLSEEHGEAMARWAAGDALQIDADTQALLDGLAALAMNGVAAEVKAFQGELQKRYPRGHALHARMVTAFNEAKAAVVARAKASPTPSATPSVSPEVVELVRPYNGMPVEMIVTELAAKGRHLEAPLVAAALAQLRSV